jgi:hypothetical protein
MIGPARKWDERRKLLASRKPQVRVDRCVVTENEKGYRDVVIEGFGLLPAVTPPLITVGGVTVELARFEQGGRRVTGIVRVRPSDGRVIVDLGYARAEGYASS